jgi:hypothetical protein
VPAIHLTENGHLVGAGHRNFRLDKIRRAQARRVYGFEMEEVCADHMARQAVGIDV